MYPHDRKNLSRTTMIMQVRHGQLLPEPKESRGYGRLILLLGVVLVLAAIFTFGILPRLRGADGHDLADEPKLRTVKVVSPERAPGGTLTLPATLKPFQTTNIYARVSGYL